MLKHACLAALMPLMLWGCVIGDEETEPTVGVQEAGGGSVYKRVVLGRLYQAGRWMLPGAEGYKAAQFPDPIDQRIHYACDAIVRLDPTYVSGLVRLAWDDVITPDIERVFRGVKQCVRDAINHPVKFDVVLNAKHYTEPRSSDPKNGVGSLAEGRTRLRAILDAGNAQLQPDIWFFDFYSIPFNDNSQAYFTDAMRDGIKWIKNDHLLVGGNVWGKQVPDGTDFAALPLIGGVEGTMDQIKALHSKVPTFMHIRNDPQVCDSEGLDWFTWTPARRAGAIENVASKQKDLDVGYMYPLFFPLTATAECAAPGEKQVAYDAAADGQLAKIKNLMDRYQYRPGR